MDIRTSLARYWTPKDRNESVDDEKGAKVPLLDEAVDLSTSDSADDYPGQTRRLSSEVSSWSQTRKASQVESLWKPVPSLHESFNPSIEGLRGIAVSLTMACHVLRETNLRASAGTMGVTIFFVLSGFLITAVLIRLQSKTASAYGHLRVFYSDRLIRLGPALFLMVGITYCVHLYHVHDTASLNRYALLSLSYLSNFRSLWYKEDYGGPWGNTWSLACEEQFYIIWSIALPFVLSRSMRVRSIIMASLIGFFVFLRFWSSMYPDFTLGIDWRFGLWANMWKMLVGASLRIVDSPPWLLKTVYAYIGLAGLAITLLLAHFPQPRYEVLTPGWSDYLGPIQGWTDVSAATCTSLILFGVSGAQGGIAMLELEWLRFIGRISYAFYLWQVPMLTLSGWHKVYPALADTAVAFVVAMCSTMYVEEPLRHAYKAWKGRQHHTLPA